MKVNESLMAKQSGTGQAPERHRADITNPP